MLYSCNVIKTNNLLFLTYYFLVWDDQCAIIVFIVGCCVEVLNIFDYLCERGKVNYCTMQKHHINYSSCEIINAPCLCVGIQKPLLPPQLQRWSTDRRRTEGRSTHTVDSIYTQYTCKAYRCIWVQFFALVFIYICTHWTQQTLRFSNSSTAAKETNQHHQTAGTYQDIHTWNKEQIFNYKVKNQHQHILHSDIFHALT